MPITVGENARMCGDKGSKMNIYEFQLSAPAQTSRAEAGVHGQECEGVSVGHRNSSLAGGVWGSRDKFKLQRPFMVSSGARLWGSICKAYSEKQPSCEMLKGFSKKHMGSILKYVEEC